VLAREYIEHPMSGVTSEREIYVRDILRGSLQPHDRKGRIALKTRPKVVHGLVGKVS